MTKTIITLIICVTGTGFCLAQEWNFFYDASGNRIKRTYSSTCFTGPDDESQKKGDDADENSGYNNGQTDESPENADKSGKSKPGSNEMNETGKPLAITPNPSHGKITLNGLHPDVIGTVEIYNVLGELVFSLPFGEGWGGVIDLSMQPKGIYMVKAVSGEEVYMERVVVE